MSYPLLHPRSGEGSPLLLTADAFREAFPYETELVEFKEGLSDERIQEVLVAFSNTDGGVLLIGVSDRGEVKGQPATGETVARLHRIARAVHDVGRYDILPVTVDDRQVTVVSVDRRREGFAQTSKGQLLVRRGAMNVPLFGRELVDFMSRRAMQHYETTPTDLGEAEIAPPLLAELGQAWGWQPGDALQRCREQGLLTDDHGRSRLTVAGALLLHDHPHVTLGRTFVEVFRYRDDAVDYDRRVRFDGPAQRQILGATRFLTEELGSDLVVLGAHRYQLPRLPEVVIREALANAVAHRSYETNTAAIRVELRPDAVTVSSPGTLPEPVTVSNIREQNAARNDRLIRSLRQLRLAEDAGRGVDVMQDTMRTELLGDPLFEDNGSNVVVTLPLHSTVTPQERAWVREVERRGEIQPKDALLLVHAARGRALNNAAARKLLQEDSTVVRARLQRLCDVGLLRRQGERAGAQYLLNASLNPPAGLLLNLDELEKIVLRLAAEGPIDNTTVRSRTGLERHRAAAMLGRLVAEGRLERTGTRRGTRYHLPGHRSD